MPALLALLSPSPLSWRRSSPPRSRQLDRHLSWKLPLSSLRNAGLYPLVWRRLYPPTTRLTCCPVPVPSCRQSFGGLKPQQLTPQASGPSGRPGRIYRQPRERYRRWHKHTTVLAIMVQLASGQPSRMPHDTSINKDIILTKDLYISPPVNCCTQHIYNTSVV